MLKLRDWLLEKKKTKGYYTFLIVYSLTQQGTCRLPILNAIMVCDYFRPEALLGTNFMNHVSISAEIGGFLVMASRAHLAYVC